jgi:polyphosphate kinase
MLDLTWLFQLVDSVRKQENHTTYRPTPFSINQDTLFEAISQEDILLHHPFDSFDPVVHFIEAAASDPDVLAIKQVLYRVGGDSPIVKALQRAASAGKQVTVLVELMARFDEENNILWAKALEQHGCHVIYGLEGIKTHAKIALVVRNEGDGIQRYVHLSTGNYNDKTARIYTDISLFTCHEQIAQDASKFFNTLTGYVNYTDLHLLISAPHHLKRELIQLIETEIHWANQGRPARIIAKMNSLVDSEVISTLYKASNAGVDIDLIVRGICCLIPAKKGLSERIRVISVIGNYLEHSRIFHFHNNGDEKCYISSADWMPRNLIKRVELMTPIVHPKNTEYLKRLLNLYLTTSKKTHQLTATGQYISLTLDDHELSVQQQLERQSSLLWSAV